MKNFLQISANSLLNNAKAETDSNLNGAQVDNHNYADNLKKEVSALADKGKTVVGALVKEANNAAKTPQQKAKIASTLQSAEEKINDDADKLKRKLLDDSQQSLPKQTHPPIDKKAMFQRAMELNQQIAAEKNVKQIHLPAHLFDHLLGAQDRKFLGQVIAGGVSGASSFRDKAAQTARQNVGEKVEKSLAVPMATLKNGVDKLDQAALISQLGALDGAVKQYRAELTDQLTKEGGENKEVVENMLGEISRLQAQAAEMVNGREVVVLCCVGRPLCSVVPC